MLNEEYLTALFKPYPFLCYQVISEHFGENRVTLWLTFAKLRCTKLCAVFFLEHLVYRRCCVWLSGAGWISSTYYTRRRRGTLHVWTGTMTRSRSRHTRRYVRLSSWKRSCGSNDCHPTTPRFAKSTATSEG